MNALRGSDCSSNGFPHSSWSSFWGARKCRTAHFLLLFLFCVRFSLPNGVMSYEETKTKLFPGSLHNLPGFSNSLL